ncbi:efflux RND transporter periplasmic adaptor subunit [Niabella ginsengisoli]|uniref:Efflux RND transporter periplasmic adaptor subunit n=1 Tax=Niabella ginsengisoli TaxID=522298 RepID=A0ABS9SRB1_9BACT|nr:efflux RND transporter periplasmic adaptor subunit [Niabella ginsengisoli]MCH5600925.1 efflux RND transporter periplasmic adaptor subunit [Niabella ginsengisoli]
MNITKVSIVPALLLTLVACKGKQQAGPPANAPVPVVVVQVSESGNTVYYDEYPATLVPLNQSEVRPQVTGYITGIHFKDGAKVSKGQKLYTIDQQTYQANYQAALADVAVQETNLIKAQKDAERYHALDKQDAIAKQQVDYADAALAAAKKQVAAAKASANAVRANVNFATIYAPFSGTIGISQVRLGTSVVAGQSILNTVSTDNPMAVDFVIDQKEIYRFSKLQSAKNNVDSTFSLAFGDDVYPQHGKIQIIDRAVDPQTGAIKVRLVFPNDNQMLKAGMSGTVRVLNSASSRSVLIPYKAIVEQLGDFFVYAVGDSSKVSQRKVTLGTQIGPNILIKEGLQAGETIVVEGVQNLREGAKITTDTTKAKK